MKRCYRSKKANSSGGKGDRYGDVGLADCPQNGRLAIESYQGHVSERTYLNIGYGENLQLSGATEGTQ